MTKKWNELKTEAFTSEQRKKIKAEALCEMVRIYFKDSKKRKYEQDHPFFVLICEAEELLKDASNSLKQECQDVSFSDIKKWKQKKDLPNEDVVEKVMNWFVRKLTEKYSLENSET